MSRRHVIATIAFTLLASAVIAAQGLSGNPEQAAASARHRNYTWAPGTALGNADDDARLVAAVERQLAQKQLAPAAVAADADLTIACAVRIARRVQVVVHSTSWSATSSGRGGGPATAMTQDVFAATLVIEARDAAGGVVWRGTRSIDIDPKATPEDRGRRIEKAVAKILASLPA